MAYDDTKVVNVKALKDTATRIKTEYLAAISKAGHARFQVAEAVPEATAAEDNVLYLVKNDTTNHYDVYALIDGTVELLDDTTVSLEGYVTDDELTEALNGVGGGAVYTATKTDLAASDESIIIAYFSGVGATAQLKTGDMFVVVTTVDDVTYEMTAYRYDGENWVSITGNVDADKVILQEDITLAGDYTQVGNLTKTANGTATLSAKGKSVAEVFTEILSKRLQPTITAQPSISGFNLSGAKAVEAGTSLATASLTAGTLNPGSYQYGPETGVAASNWVVQRVTDLGTEQIASVDAASLDAQTDNNGGAGFIIGDEGGDNVVSSLKYTATATHGAGVTADDNLGSDSDPVVAIAAGTKSKTTSAYTPFRNFFYGATVDKPTLDSDYIRGLNKSNKAYVAGDFTINVPVGAQRVCIACISSKGGVIKVINETAMNADVTSTFTMSVVKVEGAEGYTAVNYKVYVFEPAVPYENAATLKFTLV